MELFAFKESTFDWVKMRVYEKFDQLIVLNMGPPYSDCVANFSRFHCLNGCVKKKFRLSEYFYDGNETGLIQLNTPGNRSIEENEKHCLMSVTNRLAS